MATPRKRPQKVHETIKPLVDALNDTGLVSVAFSEPGSFGRPTKDDFQHSRPAKVVFDATVGVSEEDVERLFAYLFHCHIKSEAKWEALLEIRKHYIPGDDDSSIEYTYWLVIAPFDDNERSNAKRKDVDGMILETAESVKQFTEKNKKKPKKK